MQSTNTENKKRANEAVQEGAEQPPAKKALTLRAEDAFLVPQHPGYVDANLRRLAEKHITKLITAHEDYHDYNQNVYEHGMECQFDIECAGVRDVLRHLRMVKMPEYEERYRSALGIPGICWEYDVRKAVGSLDGALEQDGIDLTDLMTKKEFSYRSGSFVNLMQYPSDRVAVNTFHKGMARTLHTLKLVQDDLMKKIKIGQDLVHLARRSAARVSTGMPNVTYSHTFP